MVGFLSIYETPGKQHKILKGNLTKEREDIKRKGRQTNNENLIIFKVNTFFPASTTNHHQIASDFRLLLCTRCDANYTVNTETQ